MSTRKYYGWSASNMEEALEKFKNGSMGFNEACRHYKIPKPTFRRHANNMNKYTRIGRPKDLTLVMENELAEHILLLESCFFGLTTKDVRRLAFQLAEKHGLAHRFNKENETAGWKWYYKFMKDHPDIALRTPEATSMARCKGFTKKKVMEFFDKYESILDEYQFKDGQIFNVDETALSTVHKPPKILARKGKHQVGAVTSGERGLNTTSVCCMNAAGEFIPPMLIYKRKRMCDELKRGGPPDTLYTCSDSGWITKELFCDWLKHFIRCIRLEKSEKKQILLLLDGHTTHTKNLDAIMLTREYGIIMLCFPAHTTHRLQPLDKSFFKSMKHHFNQASSNWMRAHPGNVIKQCNISELLGTAYPKAVCMDTALNGFKSCGLWPPDRNVFKDEDFVTIDENYEPNVHTEPQSSANLPVLSTVSPQQNVAPHSTRDSVVKTHLLELSPIPRMETTKTKFSRGTTAVQVITSSPYKKILEENSVNNSRKVTVKKETKKYTNTRKGKRKLLNQTEKGKKKRKEETEDWFCTLCHETKEENMIQCTRCKTWVHDLCAGIDKSVLNYLCDGCKE